MHSTDAKFVKGEKDMAFNLNDLLSHASPVLQKLRICIIDETAQIPLHLSHLPNTECATSARLP
jgi:hypothetical protein